MAKTVEEVIIRLEEIVNEARRSGARYGYFATLYLLMTREVAMGIKEGVFEDGPRMEKLDVIFANRYLDAFALWKSGGKPSESWQIAFDETKKDRISVIQHLLCGINAHINLDLGIAAAETASGQALLSIESDFNKINVVIKDLMGRVQGSLNSLSWFMRFLDRIDDKADSVIANFSIQLARNAAWDLALKLDSLSPEQKLRHIHKTDKIVHFLAKRIISPGMANLALKPIHWGEPKDVGHNISVIYGE